MIATDREAVICDLAETYHIYDYQSLPCKTVAIFACGLRKDSRIKMKLAGTKETLDKMLLASISDHLATLVWFNSKDGAKGINRPKSILQEMIVTEPKEDGLVLYDSGEEFMKAWHELVEKNGGQ